MPARPIVPMVRSFGVAAQARSLKSFTGSSACGAAQLDIGREMRHDGRDWDIATRFRRSPIEGSVPARTWRLGIAAVQGHTLDAGLRQSQLHAREHIIHRRPGSAGAVDGTATESPAVG